MRTTAYLREDSPRRADWEHIFGGREVPLRGPVPGMTQIPHDGGGWKTVSCYELDVKALTPEQRQRLIAWASAKAPDLRLEEVERLIDEQGMPVLNDDVSVMSDTPWFL